MVLDVLILYKYINNHSFPLHTILVIFHSYLHSISPSRQVKLSSEVAPCLILDKILHEARTYLALDCSRYFDKTSRIMIYTN